MTAIITSLWSVPGRTCKPTGERPHDVGVDMTRRTHVSEQGRTIGDRETEA